MSGTAFFILKQTTKMVIQDILLLGNPKLLEISSQVEENDLPKLLPQIELMRESILDIRRIYGFGCAIAAPQIGLQKRICPSY